MQRTREGVVVIRQLQCISTRYSVLPSRVLCIPSLVRHIWKGFDRQAFEGVYPREDEQQEQSYDDRPVSECVRCNLGDHDDRAFSTSDWSSRQPSVTNRCPWLRPSRIATLPSRSEPSFTRWRWKCPAPVSRKT